MLAFSKYHGAGNDFIMIDQRAQQTLTRSDTAIVAQLCDRHFGIGADGLILLQNHPEFGTEMVYFNADGRESTLCGNGGRCFAAFAKHLGISQKQFRFLAIDGPHDAVIAPNEQPDGLEWVELHMNDVTAIETVAPDTFVLNTGSPHFVRFTEDVAHKNMVEEGRAVRYSERFAKEGINVNLVEKTGEGLFIRTYERGVEDETLACGTGVTAAALAYALREQMTGNQEIKVKAVGGNLSVRCVIQPDGHFSDVWLCGPAQRVFQGSVTI